MGNLPKTIMDWSEQPVLTNIETYTFPAEDVQFPTITICPSRYRMHHHIMEYFLATRIVKCSASGQSVKVAANCCQVG